MSFFGYGFLYSSQIFFDVSVSCKTISHSISKQHRITTSVPLLRHSFSAGLGVVEPPLGGFIRPLAAIACILARFSYRLCVKVRHESPEIAKTIFTWILVSETGVTMGNKSNSTRLSPGLPSSYTAANMGSRD